VSNTDNYIKNDDLAKNTGFSLASRVLPILVAIISIPVIIKYIGAEGFGILTICWLVIGYFSLFDLGLSRAIVNQLSIDLRENDGANNPKILATLSLLLFLLGVLLGLILWFSSPHLVHLLLEEAPELSGDTLFAFKIVAVGLPVTLFSSGLRGGFEAAQDFKRIAFADTLSGVGIYGGMALLAYFGQSIPVLIGYLVIVRFCIALYFYAYSKVQFFGADISIVESIRYISKAINFGKWIAVSNIVNPLMGQIDRYFIGVLISMSAVAYYSAPLDMMVKINLIPASFTAVLFPTFSYFNKRSEQSDSIFKGSSELISLLSLSIVLTIILFGEQILSIWINPEFAQESILPLQILAVAAFFTSISQIPSTYLQSIGRPDITAKLHVLEFTFYLPLLIVLTIQFGIVGAAGSRLIRILADYIFLTKYSNRYHGIEQNYSQLIVSVTMLVFIFMLSNFEIDVILKSLIGGFSILVVSVYGIKYWIDPRIIQFIRDKLTKVKL
jgi:O-antigen/teichoic acid export membrane protein